MLGQDLCTFVVILTTVNCNLRIKKYSIGEVNADLTNTTFGIVTSQRMSLLDCSKFCSISYCCIGFMYDLSQRQCTEISIERGRPPSPLAHSVSGLDQGVKIYQAGCDKDWREYRGHCYFIGPSKTTWEKAKVACLQFCSHLVEIESQEESEWLASTFLKKGTCSTYLYKDCTSWMGASDLQSEGHYIWDWSNLTFTFTYWYPNEPSGGSIELADKRDCIDILRNGHWNDRHCSYSNSYICEKKLLYNFSP